MKKDIRITIGNSIDLISLKKNILEDLKGNIEKVKASREKLYSSELIRVKRCPVCNHTSEDSKEVVRIYGAQYVECSFCTHRFIIETPSKKTLETFYSTDTYYQKTYADKRTTDVRLNQVAMPKLEWTVNEYENIYKKKPKRILDVGAGSGHFVHACKLKGYEATGIELSESGRNFCQDNFGFELDNKDFLKSHEYKNFDIVTFWGVIEHTPHPVKMLEAAKKVIGKQGMVVAQVPHWNSISTTIQQAFPTKIVRHLDSAGHINIFTEDSLKTAFQKSGFKVTAAWYLGMDAYELSVQLANAMNDEQIITRMKDIIPKLQEQWNKAKISDGIIFAGR